MSEDLVEGLVNRLEDWRNVHPKDMDKPEGHLYEEAADRIEQLEGRLARAMGWKARCEDAEAALDRRIAEAKEEGFWIGRQTGGSKAEIDMALTAIRNRSNPND